ncbi:22546_t:CDS:2 [Rhizophagus irregularis]|nr:22546_t:CDS:2 [Rhizophagus irregularis]
MKIKTDANYNSPRGRSLEDDLRLLIDDERFYDIALKCSDGVTIYGCKAILATRSDVFSAYIFNESVEKNNNLSFNDINSTAMKVILEFLYTSKFDSLNVDNIIESYFASILFDLIDLQEHIIEFTIKLSLMNENEDVGKKLLSECVKKFSLEADNKMSRVLIYWVAKNKLEKNEIDSLSLEGLRYLLEKTFDTQIPSFSTCEPQEVEEIKNHLAPIISYIDLNRMDTKEIKQHVEPFGIFSAIDISNVYCSKALDEELEFIRGIPIFKWINYKSSTSDNQIIITNGGFVAEVIQPKSILGDLIFKSNKSNGIYEWDISIEKLCGNIYIGICDVNEDLDKTDQKYHGWVLGSDGYVYYKKKWKWYDAKFKEGDKVTVHLDMKNRRCAFSINNNKKSVISEWNNIPSQVYPIVSLECGSKLRMGPQIISMDLLKEMITT